MATSGSLDAGLGVKVGLSSYTKFNGTNYSSWSVKVTNLLERLDAWKQVSGAAPRPGEVEGVNEAHVSAWDKKDKEIIGLLYELVEDSLIPSLKNQRTSAALWKHLRELHSTTSGVGLWQLKKQFFTMRMEARETMSSYISRVDAVEAALVEAGETVSVSDYVFVVCEGLPSEYRMVVSILQSRGRDVTKAMVASQLLQEEARAKGVANVGSTASALFSGAKKGKAKKGGRNAPGKGSGSAKGLCYRCGKGGHFAATCDAPAANQGSSNLAAAVQEEENGADGGGDEVEEAFDLMAHGLERPESSNSDVVRFVLDSGATHHLLGDASNFNTLHSNSTRIHLSNGQTVTAEGQGDAVIVVDNARYVLKGALLVPGLSRNLNLISVRKLTQGGLSVGFQGQEAVISSPKSRRSLRAVLRGGLYVFEARIEHNASAHVAQASTAELVHRRLGHAGQAAVSRAIEAYKLPVAVKTLADCDVCLVAKATRKPYPERTNDDSRAQDVLHRVATDVGGPLPVASLGGKQYYVTFYDEYSGKSWVYSIRQKSEVASTFSTWLPMVQLESGKNVRIVRSDNGGEYVSDEFQRQLRDRGIRWERTAPHTPSQNGGAEVLNRVLMNMVRAWIRESTLPKFLWAELINTASYVRNLLPSSSFSAGSRVPEERWSGKLPKVDHLRVIGSKAFVYDESAGSKLEGRAKQGTLVGYEDSRTFRVYLAEERNVIRSRHVRIVEKGASSIERNEQEEQGSEAEGSAKITHPVEVVLDEEEPAREPIDGADNGIADDDEAGRQSLAERRQRRVIRPPRDVYAEYANFANARLTDTAADSERDLFVDLETDTVCFMSMVPLDEAEPSSYEEAIRGPFAKEWKAAMAEEILSIHKNGTWRLEQLPRHRKAIDSKWVFKVKRDAKGNIVRRKARLCCRGFGQIEGVDFKETTAPCARFTTFRLVISFAVLKKLYLTHKDFVTAFLNGDCVEEVYMLQPQGCDDGSGRVCRMLKCLYGLRQAGRSWYLKLDARLKELGFVPAESDPCLYIKQEPGNFIAIVVWVDDLIVAAEREEAASELTALLSKSFEVKNLGQLSWCLGMQVQYDREKGTLILDQSRYIKGLIERFGMSDAKRSPTPIVKGDTVEHEGAMPKDVKYAAAVGALLYAALGTRIDIAYAVQHASRSTAAPSKESWALIKRILRYLRGTQSHAIVYKRDGSSLVGYCDSDYAELLDRHSVGSYIFLWAGAAVSWSCRRQSKIAMSTQEAEISASCEASREAQWLRKFVRDMTGKCDTIPIRTDSQAGLSWIMGKGRHARTKHYDVELKRCRQVQEAKEVDFSFVASEEQVGDFLTKPLGRMLHEKHTASSGLTAQNGADDEEE